ncbi:unnamed protein product [Mytilus coruscus]|uniref:DZIP3-like HEPN domain-containing protein n=1 Tax=Mytilus coruscus TaxID=42192 RepID=A0A6J8A757_MYTCO|nr:unnamed protein product [Mytilus coruscus]
METLPNVDDFTVELCYKILRYEVEIDEPTCKWGNIPHETEVKLSDDIQRILNATNDIESFQKQIVGIDYIKIYVEKLKTNNKNGHILPGICFPGTLSLYMNLDSKSHSFLRELTKIKTITVTPPIQQMVTASEQKVHFSRISVVIIDIFPTILRNIIGKIKPANIIYQQCIPILCSFYPDQQYSLLKLQTTNTYDSLDIPIIYKLLRHFPLIQQPTKGWGNFPDQTDVTIADDVERIRILRNEIAHRHNTNIEDKLFEEYFAGFRDICHRIDQYFSGVTGYEQSIIDCKTFSMDIQMKNKYENALKELENMKMRFESKPIRFYWGDTFETSLNSLRIMLKDQKLQGKTKIHVQIVFQRESDIERHVTLLNSLKHEINEGLTGIEFIVASQGSIVLHVTLSIDIIETDELLKSSLTLFLRKILDNIDNSSAEIVDVVLILDEEMTTELQSKMTYENKFHYSAPMYLDFNIEAELFETDDKMEEQFIKISKTIFKYSNGSGRKCDMSASILPLNLDHLVTTEDAYAQAQSPITYNLPISVTLRKQLDISSQTKEGQSIEDCIKIGNKLVFTDSEYNRLIICSVDGTDFHCIPLPHSPRYITEISTKTVAVSCSERCILIINIYLCFISRTINITGHCSEISFNDKNMYVIISRILQVINKSGNIKRTIPLPSDSILYITVHRDKLVCIDRTAIYCCYLDGTLVWKFENERYQNLQRLTTDDEGNVCD